jgi:Uma2 family endonuclease
MSTSRAQLRIRRRISPSCAGLRMSPEEFDSLTNCDDRYRYELVHGVLVVTPPPAIAERDSNGELEYLLRFYKEHHPQGSALDKTVAEHEIRPGDDRRRADRVIWAGLGRVPDPVADIPTIAVEFVSRGKRDWLRDYEEKRREYLALGVAEYWIIDRFRRTMTVYRNPPHAPAEQVIAEGGVYRTDLLPGFELPLARLLTVADQWRKKRRK